MYPIVDERGEENLSLLEKLSWGAGELGWGKRKSNCFWEKFGLRLGILICTFDLVMHSILEDYSSNIQVLE